MTEKTNELGLQETTWNITVMNHHQFVCCLDVGNSFFYEIKIFCPRPDEFLNIFPCKERMLQFLILIFVENIITVLKNHDEYICSFLRMAHFVFRNSMQTLNLVKKHNGVQS